MAENYGALNNIAADATVLPVVDLFLGQLLLGLRVAGCMRCLHRSHRDRWRPLALSHLDQILRKGSLYLHSKMNRQGEVRMLC